jgi:hypothetical protein
MPLFGARREAIMRMYAAMEETMKQIEEIFINSNPADHGLTDEDINNVYGRMIRHFNNRANLALEDWHAAIIKDIEETKKFYAELKALDKKFAEESKAHIRSLSSRNS